jgi:hypothetical protein
MASLPAHCPICHGDLTVTEAHCPSCDTTLSGAFSRGPLEGLDPGQVEFLRLFVVSRGNLRRVGKTLGISYPTVRGKLEEISAILARSGAGQGADVSG